MNDNSKIPKRVRAIVSGYLELASKRRRSFTLWLPTGQTLRCLLPPGNLEIYHHLTGKKVVAEGEAVFNSSGKISKFVVRQLEEATPADAVWEKLLRSCPRSLEELGPKMPLPPGVNGMDRIIGRWPGDETDEEIQAALDEIS